MTSIADTNKLIHRYPWIYPTLWLLVAIWTLHFVFGRMSYATSTIWGCSKMIWGWWWSIAKTILVLVGQLCIAVAGTGVAYLTAIYGVYPIIYFTFTKFLDLVEQALSSPPPPPARVYDYTHTHSDGQSYTHTHDAEQVEELRQTFQNVFEEKLRERREREVGEVCQQSNARRGGKAKRKGKKRR